MESILFKKIIQNHVREAPVYIKYHLRIEQINRLSHSLHISAYSLSLLEPVILYYSPPSLNSKADE